MALSSFMSTVQCPRCWVPSSICPACPSVLLLAPPPPLPPPPRNTTVQSSSPVHTQPAKQKSCHKDSNPLASLSCCLTARSLAALKMPYRGEGQSRDLEQRREGEGEREREGEQERGEGKGGVMRE